MSKRQEYAELLTDARISVAMMPEHMRSGVEVGFLEPKHWPEVLRRLQVIYRRATGERHAILVVENGDAI